MNTRSGGSVVGFVVVFALAAIVLIHNQLTGHNVRDEATARGLVEQGYAAALQGNIQDNNPRYKWKAIENPYGRVLAYRIDGTRSNWSPGVYSFEVRVWRERAVTLEIVDATAEPSKFYGYYARLSDIKVAKAGPYERPPWQR